MARRRRFSYRRLRRRARFAVAVLVTFVAVTYLVVPWVVSVVDAAYIGGLCMLVSGDRAELRRRVLDSESFVNVVARAPFVYAANSTPMIAVTESLVVRFFTRLSAVNANERTSVSAAPTAAVSLAPTASRSAR